MQRFTVAEAIDQLRPHFAQRDAIRTVLFAIICDTETYFVTIPRDIVNIITEFIPTLRQTYSQAYFDELLNRYNDYSKDYNEPIYKHNSPCPRTNTIFTKLCHNNTNISIGSPVTGLFHNSTYIGKCRMIARHFENPMDKKWFTMVNGKMQKCNIRETWLLPCNILIVRYSTYRDRPNMINKYRIVNHLAIDTDDFGEVVRLENIGDNTDFSKLYDDYGELIDTGLPYGALRFSSYTLEPAAFCPK